MSQILRALIRETLMLGTLNESTLQDNVTSKHASAAKALMAEIIDTGSDAVEWKQYWQEESSLDSFLQFLGRAANIDLKYPEEAPIATVAVIISFDDASKDTVAKFWLSFFGTLSKLLSEITDPLLETKIIKRLHESSIARKLAIDLTKDAVENSTGDLIGDIGKSAIKAELAVAFREIVSQGADFGPRGAAKKIGSLDDLMQLLINNSNMVIFIKGEQHSLKEFLYASVFKKVMATIDDDLAQMLGLPPGKVSMYDIAKAYDALLRSPGGLNLVQRKLRDNVLAPFLTQIDNSLSTEAEIRTIRGLASTGAGAGREIARRLPNKTASDTATKILGMRPNTRFAKLNSALSVPFATAMATWGSIPVVGVPLLWGNRTPSSGDVKAEIQASVRSFLAKCDVKEAAANLSEAIEPEEVSSSNQLLMSRAKLAQEGLKQFSQSDDLAGPISKLASLNSSGSN